MSGAEGRVLWIVLGALGVLVAAPVALIQAFLVVAAARTAQASGALSVPSMYVEVYAPWTTLLWMLHGWLAVAVVAWIRRRPAVPGIFHAIVWFAALTAASAHVLPRWVSGKVTLHDTWTAPATPGR